MKIIILIFVSLDFTYFKFHIFLFLNNIRYCYKLDNDHASHCISIVAVWIEAVNG